MSLFQNAPTCPVPAIKDGWLTCAPWEKSLQIVPTNNTNNLAISHRFLVMHFTNMVPAKAVVNLFLDPSSKVSAHIVLDKNGDIVQMVPFDTVAWHAGVSFYKGYSGLNNSSIGIEIVNEGGVKGIGKNNERASWHKEDGHYWAPFTEEQLNALDVLTPLLVDQYNIRDVVGHSTITSGRKDDPGPAFPMSRYTQFTDLGNSVSEGAYIVVCESLNVRGGPGTNFEILTKLKRGEKIKVLTRKDDWAFVQFDKYKGFVYSTFLMRA